jgi:hypothetical protein
VADAPINFVDQKSQARFPCFDPSMDSKPATHEIFNCTREELADFRARIREEQVRLHETSRLLRKQSRWLREESQLLRQGIKAEQVF